MMPASLMRSVIVFRRFSSSCPLDSLAGGADDGVAGDADERVSVPPVGSCEKGMGNLDGVWNRVSIGSAVGSVSVSTSYSRGSCTLPMSSSNNSCSNG